jgi:flagellar hook assembly protein FlgD
MITDELGNNFPNPFNPETWIPFSIAKDADVKISIYDLQGQLVRSLELGHRGSGRYFTKEKAAHWDGRNDQGERVASGPYFYYLSAGDFKATRKLVIEK